MKTYTLCIKLFSRFKTLFTKGCLRMLIYKNRFSKHDYYSIFIQISLAPHVNTLIKIVNNFYLNDFCYTMKKLFKLAKTITRGF